MQSIIFDMKPTMGVWMRRLSHSSTSWKELEYSGTCLPQQISVDLLRKEGTSKWAADKPIPRSYGNLEIRLMFTNDFYSFLSFRTGCFAVYTGRSSNAAKALRGTWTFKINTIAELSSYAQSHFSGWGRTGNGRGIRANDSTTEARFFFILCKASWIPPTIECEQ